MQRPSSGPEWRPGRLCVHATCTAYATEYRSQIKSRSPFQDWGSPSPNLRCRPSSHWRASQMSLTSPASCPRTACSCVRSATTHVQSWFWGPRAVSGATDLSSVAAHYRFHRRSDRECETHLFLRLEWRPGAPGTDGSGVVPASLDLLWEP